eukprot:TRINITY_DN8959_c0_g1_i1.p1 TRINITY_DN8959_c0_g1~~TRINITY_DN8959_c0_g1_i1.p1  ORF type:complete len:438 (+),score=105.44 TRINITY_DN8959_c0_g1_i1:109-1422(+)
MGSSCSVVARGGGEGGASTGTSGGDPPRDCKGIVQVRLRGALDGVLERIEIGNSGVDAEKNMAYQKNTRLAVVKGETRGPADFKVRQTPGEEWNPSPQGSPRSPQGSPRHNKGGAKGEPQEGTRNVLGKNVRYFKLKEATEGIEVVNTDQVRRNADLLKAARGGDFAGVINSMSEGASVNCSTLRGQTPLMLASAAYSKAGIDCVKFLLEAQAEIDTRDAGGWTALLYACSNNRADQAALLVASDASVKTRATDGKTCLMLAAAEGGDNLVQYLFEHQAQPEKKDDRGWTVLFYACSDGNSEMVKLLLRKDCSPKDTAKDGTTPLMCAASSESGKKIGTLLLKRSSNINQRNQDGNTALMIALMVRRPNFAEFLMNETANVLIKNADGRDAIDIAESNGLNAIKAKIELRARLQAEALQKVRESRERRSPSSSPRLA